MSCSTASEGELTRRFALPIQYIVPFTSRKNSVFLVRYHGKLAVCKQFNSIESAHKEWTLLFRLKSIGIPAPNPITLFGNWSIREFVDGTPISDLIDMDSHNTRWILPLAMWLYSFHRYANLKLGDVNLRNFIFQEESRTIYAIDFEDVSQGNPLEDIGDLVVHILTHRPEFTDNKFRMATMLIKSYSELARIDRENIVNELYDAFLRAAVRRRNLAILNFFHFVKKIDSLLESSI